MAIPITERKILSWNGALSYLYNGNPYTWEDDHHIEMRPKLFLQGQGEVKLTLHIWGLGCHKQEPMTWISNYISQNIVSYPYPRCLLLVPKSSFLPAAWLYIPPRHMDRWQFHKGDQITDSKKKCGKHCRLNIIMMPGKAIKTVLTSIFKPPYNMGHHISLKYSGKPLYNSPESMIDRLWAQSLICILHMTTCHIDGLVQERCNSIANAPELRLSCTNPSICNTV